MTQHLTYASHVKKYYTFFGVHLNAGVTSYLGVFLAWALSGFHTLVFQPLDFNKHENIDKGEPNVESALHFKE